MHLKLASALQALRDLADPAEGVYNATALLGDRLTFLIAMLDKYQNLPSRASAPGPNMVAGMPVPADMMGGGSHDNGNALTGQPALCRQTAEADLAYMACVAVVLQGCLSAVHQHL